MSSARLASSSLRLTFLIALLGGSGLLATACGDESAVILEDAAAGAAGAAGAVGVAGAAGAAGGPTFDAVEEPEPTFDCTDEITTCEEPRRLEVLDGDNPGGGTKSIKAWEPGWYTTVVRETDQKSKPADDCKKSVFGFLGPVCEIGNAGNWAVEGTQLSAGVDLTSPEGSNYDIEVFLYPGDGKPPAEICQGGVPSGTSSEPGENTDTVELAWGDKSGATCAENFSDDTSTLLIHVRHTDGRCDPSNEYTLALRGTLSRQNEDSLFTCD